MDTSTKHLPELGLPDQGQDIQTSRRTFYLQVILPLIVGILVLAAGIILLWQGGFGTSSAWADTALIFLMLPWLCIGLLPLALFGAFWYGVFKLTVWLPAPLRALRGYIDRAGRYLRRATDVAVQPVFAVKGAWAVLTTFFKGLASLIGIEDGELND